MAEPAGVEISGVDDADSDSFEKMVAEILATLLIDRISGPGGTGTGQSWADAVDAHIGLGLTSYLARTAHRMLAQTGVHGAVANRIVADVLPDVLEAARFRLGAAASQVAAKASSRADEASPGANTGSEALSSSDAAKEAYRRVRVGSASLAREAATELREGIRFEVAAGLGATHKTWRTKMDSRVRVTHGAMEGETRPIHDPFETIEGHALTYPGDPTAPLSETANCRCRLSYLMPAKPTDYNRDGKLINLVPHIEARIQEGDRVAPVAAAATRPDSVGKVIVALPADDDPVWDASSEQIPHQTLIWLGDQEFDDEQDSAIREAIARAARESEPTLVSVTSREDLGDDRADVAMTADDLAGVRDAILTDPEVKAAQGRVKQHPDWTPHVTLGYPKDPAPGEPPDGILFDRLAYWDGDYSGEEFPLGPGLVAAGIPGVGGNDNWRHQLRDSKGKWIEEGAEVRWLVDGAMQGGVAVGAPEEGIVEVERPDGSQVRVPARDVTVAQESKADLDLDDDDDLDVDPEELPHGLRESMHKASEAIGRAAHNAEESAMLHTAAAILAADGVADGLDLERDAGWLAQVARAKDLVIGSALNNWDAVHEVSYQILNELTPDSPGFGNILEMIGTVSPLTDPGGFLTDLIFFLQHLFEMMAGVIGSAAVVAATPAPYEEAKHKREQTGKFATKPDVKARIKPRVKKAEPKPEEKKQEHHTPRRSTESSLRVAANKKRAAAKRSAISHARRESDVRVERLGRGIARAGVRAENDMRRMGDEFLKRLQRGEPLDRLDSEFNTRVGESRAKQRDTVRQVGVQIRDERRSLSEKIRKLHDDPKFKSIPAPKRKKRERKKGESRRGKRRGSKKGKDGRTGQQKLEDMYAYWDRMTVKSKARQAQLDARKKKK